MLLLRDFRVQHEPQKGSGLLLDLTRNGSQRGVTVFVLLMFSFSLSFFFLSAVDWNAALTAFGDARLDVDHI